MIGDNIRRIMKEKKLTQAQVAKLANISQSTLSNIINGLAEPKQQTKETVADAIGVPLEQLEEEIAPVDLKCPRCGSTAVMEFTNHSNGSCRLRCGYCDLDTTDQQSRAHALNVFLSFRHKGAVAERSDNVRVLALEELMDGAECDDRDNVRPVWFENRGLFIVPSLLQCGIAERELGIARVEWHGSFGAKSFMLDQYGSWWRTWNKKPTQAQSDSVPWSE